MTDVRERPEVETGVLRGERVTLRPYNSSFNEDELRRLYRWNRDDEVLRWSGGMPLHMTFTEFKEAFPREQRRRDQQVYVILTETGELIGRLGIFDIETRQRDATLGVVIGEKSYWSQGYGSDAIRTLLRHLFFDQGFEAIHLFTYTDNFRAQRAFAKVGFRKVSTRRRFPFGLRFQDELRMEITREEFETLNGTAAPPSTPPARGGTGR